MPCRDYDDYGYGLSTLREKNDRLSRIACKAMYLIEEKHPEDFTRLMKDKEISEWWPKHKEADRKDKLKREAESAKRKALEEVKKAAMAKLTDEEKIAYGLVSTRVSKGRRK